MTSASKTGRIPTPGDGSHRRADIQGLRAVAVTLVVLYHMGLPISGGFTGVDMFFVISGYVIMESLLREFHLHGRIRFREFFLRRFKRLFPALVLVVMVTLVLSTIFLPPFVSENRTLLTGLGAIFISANVVIEFSTGDYFAPDARLNPLLHTWSLSVEEQFYLLFPVLVVVGLWWGKKRSRPLVGLFAVITLVTVVSFLLAVASARVSLPVGGSLLSFYSPLPRAWEFGAGALLSIAGRWLPTPGPAFSRMAGLAGVGLVAAGAFIIDARTAFPSEWALLPVIGTALVIYAGMSTHRSLLQRGLSTAPAVAVGNLSYSLYLWHWPLIVFATVGWSDSLGYLTVAVILSVVLSWLSYRFIEQPLRHRPTPTRASVAGFAAAVVVAPLAVIAANWFVGVHYIQPLVQTVAGSPLEKSPGRDERCLSSNRFDESWAKRCTWFEGAPGPPVYLIGDSTATQFDEGVIRAGEQLGRPVHIWNGVQCIALNGLTVTEKNGVPQRPHCSDFQDFIDTALAAGPPGTVILSFSDILQVRDDLDFTLADGTVISGQQEKGDALERPLADYIQQLSDWGHEPVVAYPIPNFQAVGAGYSPRLCALWEILNDTCAPRVDRGDMLGLQQEIRESVDRATQSTGVATLDLFDRYCNDRVCSPSRDGLLTYLDDTHISKEESGQLTPVFVELLTRR
jgi:peptidoglycan/LPS O-acetylase OafA/YrhL